MTSSQYSQNFEKVADPYKVCMLVPYQGNLIFVVRQHKDGRVSVEPPGGKRDPRRYGSEIETPEEALIREGHEELGIEIRPVEILGVEPHPYTGKSVGYYFCEHVKGIPQNIETRQHLQVIGLAPSKSRVEEFRRACSKRTVGGAPVDFRLPNDVFDSYLKRVGESMSVPTFDIPRPVGFIPKHA